MSEQKYFAQKDFKELAEHVLGQVHSWIESVGDNSTGIASVWCRNLIAYYSNIFAGNSGSDSALDYLGAQGEIVKMLVPQARSLNTQFLSLTTKQKLTFDVEALSTDARTIADTRVAQSLSEQIVKTNHLDYHAAKMAEHASILGIGYMMPLWNMSKGKKKTTDMDGKIVYAGALDLCNPTVFDVVFDYSQEDFYKLPSLTVRVPKNRWDLIAQNPDLERYLKNLPPITPRTDGSYLWNLNSNEDMVWEYHFIHASSPALPDGRYSVFCSPETMLFDDENPYKDADQLAYIPVVQMKPEPIIGCGFGYPFFSNILPLQEMLDHSFSAIASNQAAHAVQSILNPSGNDISVVNIGGLRFMNYKPLNLPGGGKPESLQLTASSPETYKFADMIRSYMMEIYNINGALRGSPPPGVTSGVAIATLATNALEFSQSFTKAYYAAVEISMTMSIWNHRTFGDEEMTVSMVGPSENTIAKTFSSDDLSAFKRARVNIGNPLMATAAGKFEVANNLLQQGMLSNPKKYFMLLEGAPTKSLFKSDYDQEAFINQENDDLRDGKQVFVAPTDDNPLHMQSHASLLNDTELRRNGEAFERVMAHVLEHYKAEMAKDPALAQMIKTGQAPQMGPPPPGAPMPPPGEAGMQPPEGLGGPGNLGGAEPAQSLLDPNQGAPGDIQPPMAG